MHFDGAAPNVTANARILLLGVQAGPLDLLADGLELVTLGMYALGITCLRRRGRRWPLTSTIPFAAGVFLVWVAVGSGLAAYDEVDVTLHMVQHILLMMVAAPLLAMGRPLTLAAQASPRRAQHGVVALANGRLFGAISHPIVATALYYGSMFGYFLTPLYPYSIDHPLFHDATHLIFLVVGYIFWQPIVGKDPARWRFSHPVRAVTLMAGMPVEGLLGLIIALSPRPLSQINTLANTHFAGRAFLATAMLISAVWIGYLLVEWVRESERGASREVRRVAAARAETRACTENGGLANVPAGWMIPEWELRRLRVVPENLE
jgi:cytochrome c oxidase assembly factor CtaG